MDQIINLANVWEKMQNSFCNSIVGDFKSRGCNQLKVQSLDSERGISKVQNDSFEINFGRLLGRQIFSAYKVNTGNCETDSGLSCWLVVSRTQRPVSKLTALQVEFVRHCSMQSVS